MPSDKEGLDSEMNRAGELAVNCSLPFRRCRRVGDRNSASVAFSHGSLCGPI